MSSIDDFEQQMNSIQAEIDAALFDTEQLYFDMTSGSINNSNSDNTSAATVPPAANDETEDSSDIEEIVQEIPVVDLLDSTIDINPGSKFIS